MLCPAQQCCAARNGGDGGVVDFSLRSGDFACAIVIALVADSEATSGDALADLCAGEWLGRYQVLRRLAVGGMAELFLARQSGIESFEKLVVVKRILPQYAEDAHFIQMFLDEARLSATFSHPNIAQVYDIGQADGQYFYAMEFVHGEDLRAILSAAGRRGSPVSLAQAIAIVAGVAAGLHAAHEKRGQDGGPLGVVHRDVSPANVLVSFDGCIKIVDFGIAKATSRAPRTSTGTIKGKACYMAPEQCLGQAVDRRTDVFAAGILLYELTTGMRPFDGDSELAVMQAVVSTAAAPPSQRVPGYPSDLETVVMRALRRLPEERYPTAKDLQLALEELAREHRLVTSQVALEQMMETLFGQEIDAWHSAQRAGRSLSSHLLDTGAATDAVTAPLPAAAERPDTASLPGAARQRAVATLEAPVAPARRPPGRRRAIAIAAGVTAVLAGGAVLAWRISARAPAAQAEPAGISPSVSPPEPSAAPPPVASEAARPDDPAMAAGTPTAAEPSAATARPASKARTSRARRKAAPARARTRPPPAAWDPDSALEPR
jgi:hypothetical protein